MAQYRLTNPDTVRASVAKSSAAWKANHPEELKVVMRAATAVYRAIQKGTLIRPSTCGACGQIRFITAAHHDYTRPLDVRWLCRSCHSAWDRAEPKLSAR